MGAQALFSRSHLNISFRDIDLFCVTYPGPFFVIKRERVGLWRGGYLGRVAEIPAGAYVSARGHIFVRASVFIGVFLCG